MATIDTNRLLAFMRQEPYAVQASVSDDGMPQAAIVGVVVSEQFEVFFDTLGTSRKAGNLGRRPHVAMVLGPTAAGSAQTVQLEAPPTNRPATTWRAFSTFTSSGSLTAVNVGAYPTSRTGAFVRPGSASATSP